MSEFFRTFNTPLLLDYLYSFLNYEIKRDFMNTNWLDRKFREDEIMKLLSSKVSIKEESKSFKTYNDIFGRFLQLKDSPNYERLMKNALMMKGWKHNEEDYNGKKKGEWFDLVKSKVPQVILSTYVEDGFSISGSTEIKNPYIIVDIDNIEVNNENLELITSFPFVLGVGTSISGEGYWAVIRISDSFKTKEDFKAVFNELCYEFEDKGLELDKQCSNLNRCRNLSPYDFLVNENFKEIYCPDISYYKTKNVKYGEIVKRKYEYDNTTKLPNKFKIYGDKGENYYREASKLELEFPLNETGRNYHILYSFANAICRTLGEDAFNVFEQYFPTTETSILESYWNSAKSWNGDVKKWICRELEQLGFALELDDTKEC